MRRVRATVTVNVTGFVNKHIVVDNSGTTHRRNLKLVP